MDLFNLKQQSLSLLSAHPVCSRGGPASGTHVTVTPSGGGHRRCASSAGDPEASGGQALHSDSNVILTLSSILRSLIQPHRFPPPGILIHKH